MAVNDLGWNVWFYEIKAIKRSTQIYFGYTCMYLVRRNPVAQKLYVPNYNHVQTIQSASEDA